MDCVCSYHVTKTIFNNKNTDKNVLDNYILYCPSLEHENDQKLASKDTKENVDIS